MTTHARALSCRAASGPAATRRVLALAAGLLSTAACVGNAAPAAAQRIEVHTVPSVMLTAQQLFDRSTQGAAPVVIVGELRLAASAPERMPAVLMLHGDAGAVANQAAWIDELNRIGIAVFTLDSFTARGAVATGSRLATMPPSIPGSRRVVDA